MRSFQETKQQQAKELIAVIKYAGSQANLARECGVSQQSVHRWVKRGSISKKGATTIHRVTDGYFKREEMRPDVVSWRYDL
jgi:DNA-binding transcriptional regulator YdaS (Cro superfamily)